MLPSRLNINDIIRYKKRLWICLEKHIGFVIITNSERRTEWPDDNIELDAQLIGTGKLVTRIEVDDIETSN